MAAPPALRAGAPALPGICAGAPALPGLRAGAPALRALADGARGRVASVHRRAAALLLEGGALVVLLPERTPLHPWALAAPLDPRGLAEGSAVAVAGGIVTVADLRISVADAEAPDLRLARRPTRLPAAAARGLSRCAAPRGRTGSAPFPADHAADPFLDSALDRFRSGGGAACLAGIVGLGPGLTPSGDDALIGVLATLDLAARAHPPAIPLRRAIVRALAPRLARRTTRLSAQLLASAAAGLYAEPLLCLLAALADGGAPAARQESAVAALLAVGHRSGADTLRGVAAALDRLSAA